VRDVLDGIKDVVGGFIVRTAGEGADPAAFRADAVALSRLWQGIQSKAAAAASPSVVFSEPDLLIRMLRDAPGDGLDRVELDDPSDHERALQYLSQVAPVVATRVRLHAGLRSLFEAHGIDQDVERALRPKVWLPSGGSIVVQQTEALVSIDVNTGKFVGSRHPEQTVLRTNLEAAVEIARQIRLRDLGGIIVIDFIDMEDPESRRRVIDSLQNALRRDRARTKIVGLSELGLLQLTRKRTRTALEGSLTRPCPTCGGHGRVRRAAAVAREALEEVRRIRPDLEQQPLTLRVHPDVVPAVERALEAAERGGPWDLGGHILVEADPTLHPDHFDVILR
jgi:ribonuclease G